MNNDAHFADTPDLSALAGNGAQEAPGAPPPEEASPFDVPAVDGERGSEGARGAKVTLRSSVTEYFTAVVIGATPRMTMTTEVAISAVNSHVCNVGGMVAPSSPRVPMQTKSMANRSGSRRSRPWLPPAPDATMSRQPRARETSGLLATSRDVRDVQERQERLMERQERGQERLMEVTKRQTAVTRELNAKAIELIGAQREAHRLQMIASVEASRKVNELKSALSHFMNATDRTLRSLDSPREGGISRIHFAAAERCLGAEWSAIEALMRDIPACAVFAPCFSKLAHLQLAALACAKGRDAKLLPELLPSLENLDSGRPSVTSHLLPAIDDHYYHIQSSASPSAALYAEHVDRELPPTLPPPEPPPKEIDKMGPFSCFFISISTVPHATLSLHCRLSRTARMRGYLSCLGLPRTTFAHVSPLSPPSETGMHADQGVGALIRLACMK